MNIQDKYFYGLVAQEMSTNIIDTGLMTKALAEMDFDENRSKALYIKMRVADLVAQNKQQEQVLKQQLLSENKRKAILKEQEKNDEDTKNSTWSGILIASITFTFFLFLISKIIEISSK